MKIKHALLTITLLIGILLLAYAWLLSYPLVVNGPNDFVFNHISIFYWVGVEITLVSLYLMAISVNNKLLKVGVVLLIILTMYSLSFYFYYLPGSDAEYFRGLNEYYLQTGQLDVDPFARMYYEWPGFFLLNNIAVITTGLPLVQFDFLLFIIIGLVLFTGIYKMVDADYGDLGVLALLMYSIAMFYFLDYQSVPFSLAFALLMLLFALTKGHNSKRANIIMLILFIACSFIHLFVSLFFICYLLLMFIFTKKKRYIKSILIFLSIYAAVQMFVADISFGKNLLGVFYYAPKYSLVAQSTFASSSIPIDSIVQQFSRIDILVSGILCSVGFFVLLLRRKVSYHDKAIFLTGIGYLVAGSVVYLVGLRGLPLAFIPMSAGIYFFYKKHAVIMKITILLLISLFVFQPMHLSFITTQITFQTEDAHSAENFLINSKSWKGSYTIILSHYRVMTYLQAKLGSNNIYWHDLQPLKVVNMVDYKPHASENFVVVYTAGLANNLLLVNLTIVNLTENVSFYQVYDNKNSIILLK